MKTKKGLSDKEKRNFFYKRRKTNENKRCIDCKKLIHYKSSRCRGCRWKVSRKGKKLEEIYSKKTLDNYNKAIHPTPTWLIKFSEEKKGKTLKEIFGRDKAKSIMEGLRKSGHFKKLSKIMKDGGGLKARMGNKGKPNKKERILINLIQQNNLNFIFVGNGKRWIEGFNPDFISKDNTKIIEFNGDYWHNLPGTKEKDKKKLDTYSKNGYKTLVIWEHELRNLNGVLNKIKSLATIQ